jgi:hypothetical protein
VYGGCCNALLEQCGNTFVTTIMHDRGVEGVFGPGCSFRMGSALVIAMTIASRSSGCSCCIVAWYLGDFVAHETQVVQYFTFGACFHPARFIELAGSLPRGRTNYHRPTLGPTFDRPGGWP